MTSLTWQSYPQDIGLWQTNVGHRLETPGSPLSGSAGTSGLLGLYGVVAITSILVVQPPSHGAAFRTTRAPKEFSSFPTPRERTQGVGSSPEASPPPVRASEPEEAGAAQAMVQEIRHWLSLNVTELARVIGVERATIYGWIKGTAAMPRELAKRDRLRLVSHIAQQWRDAANEPLGSWRQFPISDGRSLLDLLDASRDVSEGALHLAVTDLARESRHAGAARLAGIRQREGAPSGPEESADARLEANLKWLRTTGAG